jgi:hypothetical protein
MTMPIVAGGYFFVNLNWTVLRLGESPHAELKLLLGIAEVLQIGRQTLQEFVKLSMELFPLLRGEYADHLILSGR